MRWLCFRLETPPDVYSQFNFGPGLTSGNNTRVVFIMEWAKYSYYLQGNNDCVRIWPRQKHAVLEYKLGTAAINILHNTFLQLFGHSGLVAASTATSYPGSLLKREKPGNEVAGTAHQKLLEFPRVPAILTISFREIYTTQNFNLMHI